MFVACFEVRSQFSSGQSEEEQEKMDSGSSIPTNELSM
jgi:hypothetical protein